jgi:hypothetical protein
MGDGMLKPEKNVSKMFTGVKGALSADEQLALEIIHKFNICRDTLETMPAFEEHIKPLFSKVRDK